MTTIQDTGGVVPSRANVEVQTRSGTIALAVFAAALVALVSMPWWAHQGTIRSVVELCCYIAIAQMWNLMAGYGGLVSVGQQAFSGAAAYALFALAQNMGVSPFLAVPIALLVPALLAIPTYGLLHRLDGPYFAIGTWVVAEVVRLLVTNSAWLNGGAGMSLRVMTQYSADQRAVGITVLCALLLLTTVGGSYLLLRSRFGLALTAMRDNPVAAASQGIDVRKLRFLVFVAGAVGTGFAGCVYYMTQLRISPESAFGSNWAMIAIFIVMIGGIGKMEGVVVGALIYFLAERLFGQYGATYLVVLGVLTLIVALYARGGVWGLVSRLIDAPWFPTRRTLRLEKAS